MSKRRTRQSSRREATEIEIKRIKDAILNALSRDIDQFLEEQRQQAALELIGQAEVLNALKTT